MKAVSEELPTGFLGRSARITQIRAQIEKIGLGRAPVLIQGESGTGKEVAARALFNVNPQGSFVPIDCGCMVGTLMESELFGHARHAFTGAGESKRGLMELANGGTAFFDEIGDLAPELQVKLLRVLQEHEYRPVGSLQRIKLNVRVVAATHRNLTHEIAAGRFREDLYHRLNVIRLTLPPLRERKEDIPQLVDRFLAKAERRYTITNEAMDALMRYDWPGNIRELQNCVDRMIALNSGPLLHFTDLPSNLIYHVRAGTDVVAAAVATGAPRTLQLPAPGISTNGIVPLQKLERQAIAHALQQTAGDRTAAAFLLGIGRTTLYRKLKEYQLEGSEANPTC